MVFDPNQGVFIVFERRRKKKVDRLFVKCCSLIKGMIVKICMLLFCSNK